MPVTQAVSAGLVLAARVGARVGDPPGQRNRNGHICGDADSLPAGVHSVPLAQVQVAQLRHPSGVPAFRHRARSHGRAQPRRRVRRIGDPPLTLGTPGLAPCAVMDAAQALGGVSPRACGNPARGRCEEVPGRRHEPLNTELWPQGTRQRGHPRVGVQRKHCGQVLAGGHRPLQKPTRASSLARSSVSRCA